MMCRMLFAYIPEKEFDRASLVRNFLRLAEVGKVPKAMDKGHRDGWGLAAYRDGQLLRHVRFEGSGANDPQSARELSVLQQMGATVILAHLRKASIGEPAERNSHPFIAGDFTFIHNGTLGNPDQDIFSAAQELSKGETDSERYFHLIINELVADEIHDVSAVVTAITKTVQAIKVGTSFGGKGYSSASSILTDGNHSYILREFDEHHPLVIEHEAHDYYTLYLGRGIVGEIIVCSEELEISGVTWELLPNHSLTVMDLSNGKLEQFQV